MHIFHKWGKWEDFEVPKRKIVCVGLKSEEVQYNEQWQRKRCTICDIVETRKVFPGENM